jgi:hypothetical protein
VDHQEVLLLKKTNNCEKDTERLQNRKSGIGDDAEQMDVRSRTNEERGYLSRRLTVKLYHETFNFNQNDCCRIGIVPNYNDYFDKNGESSLDSLATAVNLGLQNTDIWQVPILALVVHAIPNNELVLYFKAIVVNRHVNTPP